MAAKFGRRPPVADEFDNVKNWQSPEFVRKREAGTEKGEGKQSLSKINLS
jgi:hypothetical protein